MCVGGCGGFEFVATVGEIGGGGVGCGLMGGVEGLSEGQFGETVLVTLEVIDILDPAVDFFLGLFLVVSVAFDLIDVVPSALSLDQRVLEIILDVA